MEVARFFEISIEVQYAEYTSYSTVKTNRAAIPLEPKPKSFPARPTSTLDVGTLSIHQSLQGAVRLTTSIDRPISAIHQDDGQEPDSF